MFSFSVRRGGRGREGERVRGREGERVREREGKREKERERERERQKNKKDYYDMYKHKHNVTCVHIVCYNICTVYAPVLVANEPGEIMQQQQLTNSRQGGSRTLGRPETVTQSEESTLIGCDHKERREERRDRGEREDYMNTSGSRLRATVVVASKLDSSRAWTLPAERGREGGREGGREEEGAGEERMRMRMRVRMGMRMGMGMRME
ncbi:hypothetical protein EDD21DRAFT_70037 [Dissophora ornata]|nr:hypothetical protein EDD21DRAFT_70037 [Dissophora ornata]